MLRYLLAIFALLDGIFVTCKPKVNVAVKASWKLAELSPELHTIVSKYMNVNSLARDDRLCLAQMISMMDAIPLKGPDLGLNILRNSISMNATQLLNVVDDLISAEMKATMKCMLDDLQYFMPKVVADHSETVKWISENMKNHQILRLDELVLKESTVIVLLDESTVMAFDIKTKARHANTLGTGSKTIVVCAPPDHIAWPKILELCKGWKIEYLMWLPQDAGIHLDLKLTGYGVELIEKNREYNASLFSDEERHQLFSMSSEKSVQNDLYDRISFQIKSAKNLSDEASKNLVMAENLHYLVENDILTSTDLLSVVENIPLYADLLSSKQISEKNKEINIYPKTELVYKGRYVLNLNAASIFDLAKFRLLEGSINHIMGQYQTQTKLKFRGLKFEFKEDKDVVCMGGKEGTCLTVLLDPTQLEHLQTLYTFLNRLKFDRLCIGFSVKSSPIITLVKAKNFRNLMTVLDAVVRSHYQQGLPDLNPAIFDHFNLQATNSNLSVISNKKLCWYIDGYEYSNRAFDDYVTVSEYLDLPIERNLWNVFNVLENEAMNDENTYKWFSTVPIDGAKLITIDSLERDTFALNARILPSYLLSDPKKMEVLLALECLDPPITFKELVSRTFQTSIDQHLTQTFPDLLVDIKKNNNSTEKWELFLNPYDIINQRKAISMLVKEGLKIHFLQSSAPKSPSSLAPSFYRFFDDLSQHSVHCLLGHLYTLSLVGVPHAWQLTPLESINPTNANNDLDNMLFKEQDEKLDCSFSLSYLLIHGQAMTNDSRPAKGTPLTLDSIDDTIVMANYGYFQLKAPSPGTFTLKTVDERLVTDVSMHSWDGAFKLLSIPEDSFISSVKNTITDNPISSWLFPSVDDTIHLFCVASGHLYEKLLSIMIISARKHTKHPIKLWLLCNFLSPTFLTEHLPYLADVYEFTYECVHYSWPPWLRLPTEKQRLIWAYKILFLDVLFPLSLKRVIFVDADQIIRTDLYALMTLPLQGHVYAFTPMGSSNAETEGYRFWKSGYWKNILDGKPYHISALFVVDLEAFRKQGAGDLLRAHYQQLSADPGNLANLDQDLPNNLQHILPIYSLPQEWLWCETWCSLTDLSTAKTIDLCNNPMTKEHKLTKAKRLIPEWSTYEQELNHVLALVSQFRNSTSENWKEFYASNDHDEL